MPCLWSWDHRVSSALQRESSIQQSSVTPISPLRMSLEVKLGDGEHKGELREPQLGKDTLVFPPVTTTYCTTPYFVDGPKLPLPTMSTLHREQDFSCKYSLGVSMFVPFSLSNVGYAEGVWDNVGSLCSQCLRGLSVASLVSLPCPMASTGLVFSPYLVTPFSSSWVVGGSLNLKDFPFPGQSTLQDVGVLDPNYLGYSSCPSSPSPSIEVYTTSLLS